jgi:hypothetical protein
LNSKSVGKIRTHYIDLAVKERYKKIRVLSHLNEIGKVEKIIKYMEKVEVELESQFPILLALK